MPPRPNLPMPRSRPHQRCDEMRCEMRLFSRMSSALSRRHLLRQIPLAALAGGFHIHARSQESKQLWATGNPNMDKAREIAVNLLKPTQAQLAHAWELHF